MHFFFSAGVGGKGVLPGRPMDQFGIGFYYIDVSSLKLTGALGTRDLLRDEYGFEAYYDVAITPWLKLTPDIQVIRPAQKEVITVVPGPISGVPRIVDRENVGTATVLGLRLRIPF